VYTIGIATKQHGIKVSVFKQMF